VYWEGENLFRRGRRELGSTGKLDGDGSEMGGLLWSRGQVRGMKRIGEETTCRQRERVGLN
jgi:hypothetical protein